MDYKKLESLTKKEKNIINVTQFCADIGVSKPTFYSWKTTGIPNKYVKRITETLNSYIEEIKSSIEDDINWL